MEPHHGQSVSQSGPNEDSFTPSCLEPAQLKSRNTYYPSPLLWKIAHSQPLTRAKEDPIVRPGQPTTHFVHSVWHEVWRCSGGGPLLPCSAVTQLQTQRCRPNAEENYSWYIQKIEKYIYTYSVYTSLALRICLLSYNLLHDMMHNLHMWHIYLNRATLTFWYCNNVLS